MKSSKVAAILFVAGCFLSLIINCEGDKNKATKPQLTSRQTDGGTGKGGTAGKPGEQGSQESGKQNSGSNPDTSTSSQQATNPEDGKNDENPDVAHSNEDRRRKESTILGTLLDLWSRIVFPFGASLVLAAILYFLFVLKKRMNEIEDLLDKDLRPTIGDIKGKLYGDKPGPSKLAKNDSPWQSDLLKLNDDLIEIKRIAQNVETELSGLKREMISKGISVRQESDGRDKLDEAPATDGTSIPSNQSFVLSDPEEGVKMEITAPFPVPTSVADCLGYLESANIPTMEVKGEGLREGGVFVQAPGGKFLLIAGADKAQKYSFVIPRVVRFATVQDYSHYQKYYDCDEPSSGDVWIKRPTLVVLDSERREWRLIEKGQLEVRS